MNTGMTRRAFLGGAATIGVAGTAAIARAADDRGSERGSFKLPARGEFVIRSGYVMTMDPALGDVARGDVHVKNGDALAKANLLGKDVQLIHAIWINAGGDPERRRRRLVGEPVALHRAADRLRLSPDGGAPRWRRHRRAVGRHHVLSGNADMFAIMKAIQNVDTVVVDGRILKRRGKLAAFDTRQIVNQASAALAGVRKRGNWW